MQKVPRRKQFPYAEQEYEMPESSPASMAEEDDETEANMAVVTFSNSMISNYLDKSKITLIAKRNLLLESPFFSFSKKLQNELREIDAELDQIELSAYKATVKHDFEKYQNDIEQTNSKINAMLSQLGIK